MRKTVFLFGIISCLGMVSSGAAARSCCEYRPQLPPSAAVAQPWLPANESGMFEPAPETVVFFETDSAELSEAARNKLGSLAEWMMVHSDANVTLEGHCDERGSDAYNMELGLRRANAARDFLVKIGIQQERVSAVSFGKSRPAASGSDSVSLSVNRRVSVVN